MITVRPAHQTDLPLLVEFWHEKWTLLSHADARIRLAGDARSRWIAQVTAWLDDPAVCVLAAFEGERAAGYIIGQDAPLLVPGLLPDRGGLITDIALDAHRAYPGAARLLVDGLRTWFVQRDIERVMVWVSPRQPVEQAFWRALGAVEWMESLWLSRL